jgi:hypothetical protein
MRSLDNYRRSLSGTIRRDSRVVTSACVAGLAVPALHPLRGKLSVLHRNGGGHPAARWTVCIMPNLDKHRCPLHETIPRDLRAAMPVYVAAHDVQTLHLLRETLPVPHLRRGQLPALPYQPEGFPTVANAARTKHCIPRALSQVTNGVEPVPRRLLESFSAVLSAAAKHNIISAPELRVQIHANLHGNAGSSAIPGAPSPGEMAKIGRDGKSSPVRDTNSCNPL